MYVVGFILDYNGGAFVGFVDHQIVIVLEFSECESLLFC